MIFEEQVARKPNKYPWTKDFVRTMHNGFWTVDLFKFQSDVHDFKTELNEEERQIVVKTLSAIGQIEVAVKTFWAKLGDNLPHPSLKDLGYVMANVEVIHNEAYEKLLSLLGLDDVFEQNLKLEVVQGRVNYLRKYLHKFYEDSKKQYVYALILFTLFVENVSLFSQFYIINWFGRYRNVLKDTNQQVQYTRQEENIHAQVGIKIINVIREEHPELFDEELENKVQSEALKAFEAESKIIDWIVGDYKGERINGDILKEYIKSRINASLKQIKFSEPFKINESLERDFEWMDEEVLGNSSTDFFYQRPIEYAKKSKSCTRKDLFDD